VSDTTAEAAVARLVEADPSLAALPFALDDGRLADLLAEHGRRLRARRAVRYKPGTSVVVTLDLDDGPAWLLGTTPAATAKIDKTTGRAPAGSIIAADVDRGLLLARPAADRDLPGARHPERTLRRLLPDLSARPHTLRPLVHNAQRRWVAHARSDDDGAESAGGAAGDGVLLRAYRNGRFRAHLQVLRRVGDLTPLAPPLVAHSTRRATLAVAFVPGEPLDAALARGHAGGVELRAVGRALAALHGCRRSGLPAADAGAHRASARQVAWLLPHLGPRLQDLTDRIAAGLAAAGDEPEALCHGDFSADQVVLRPDGAIRLIDWDHACIGAAGDDIAGAAAAGLEDPALTALQDGYAEMRPLPGMLHVRTAAALLRRAPEPFRHCEPDWPTGVERMLDRAEELLG
jgi:hypothetical protein